MSAMVVTGELQLQELMLSLKSEGKVGGKIIRKAIRAGAKIVAKRVKAGLPSRSGGTVRSVKVRAMKRKKGRIGVRIAIESRTKDKTELSIGMLLERGVKQQRSMVNYRNRIPGYHAESGRIFDAGAVVTRDAASGRFYDQNGNGGRAFDAQSHRVRKKYKRIGGGRRGVSDTTRYDSLAWHVEPQHNVEKAFDAVQAQAQDAILQTAMAGIEAARAVR